MFAVPGWSVSAAQLKTQTTPIPQQASRGAPGSDEHTKSKKRKRGKEKAPDVNGENVGDLWHKHFEATTEGSSKDSGSKKKAKRKAGEADIVDEKAALLDTVKTATESGPLVQKGARAEQEGATTNVPVTGEKKLKKDKKGETKGLKGAQSNGNPEKGTGSSKAVAIQNATPPVPPLPAAKLTPMQAAMRQKLISARFRHLNQTLYTAPSTTSLTLFADNPEMFDDYHSGFRQQVAVWPENPVDNFIATLRARARVKPKFIKDRRQRKPSAPASDSNAIQPLTRTHGTCTIADLGCGDARLASTLQASGEAQKHTLDIKSFDLQSPSPVVTKADIANLPLEDGSVDVAIFCLALMGTNWIDFIEETYRILHWKGELWIAEIKSRFGRAGGDKGKGGKGRVVEHSVGNKRKAAAMQKAGEADKKKKDEKDEEQALAVEVDGVETGKVETDVGDFVKVLARRGFVLKSEEAVDLSNKMFVKMEFIKAAQPVVGKNVRVEREAEAGKEESTWKKKQKMKFVEEKEVDVEDEAKVLKPCLYKIR